MDDIIRSSRGHGPQVPYRRVLCRIRARSAMRRHRCHDGNQSRSSPVDHLRAHMAEAVLSPEELSLIDAYWRAANYLSVGQIYLLDNPLLRRPLGAEHIKPRLLGHWGTTPGLNL